MASSSAGPSMSSDENFPLVLLEGWIENDPSTTVKRTSLRPRGIVSLCKAQSARRTFLSLEEERALAIPRNTTTSTKWAVLE